MLYSDFSDFVVQEIEEYQGLPDGDYVAQVDHMECVNNEYGKYYAVNWKILRPLEFEGHTHQERFNINHSNEQVREIAIRNFDKFCVEIGGLSKGGVPSEKNFLFKVANILIRNKAAKDGRKYANIVRRSLQYTESVTINNTPDNAMSKYGAINIPQGSQSSNVPLNDDVPF
jgi:hypothetical protein